MVHLHIDAIKHLIKSDSTDVLLVKIVVMVGMFSTILLPAEHAVYVNTATNLVWLWRV